MEPRISPQIVTVALNPALDQTVELEALRPGEVNRAQRMQIDVGGKGINVASCLADFGIRAAVVGLLGRENATPFEELFRRKHLGNHCIALSGATRVNTHIVDRISGETTDINLPGRSFTTEAMERLKARLIERLDALTADASWVVLTGTLPPGWPANTYQELTHHIQRRGVQVLLDACGPALAAGFAANPAIAKPNHTELAELLGRPLDDTDSVLAAAREQLAHAPGLRLLVVSLGSKGALFVSRDESWLAHPAKVALISTVGAGDAMVAGILCAQLEALELAECARLATAFAAAKLARLGPHLPEADQVRALASTIRLSRVE